MTSEITITPVMHGDRQVGAWITGPDATATYRPVVDVTRLAGAALTAAAIATAVALATRRRPVIGAVTMGPGGWVSVKRTGCPPLRSTVPRPWWARLLGAHRLVVEQSREAPWPPDGRRRPGRRQAGSAPARRKRSR